MAPNPDPPRLLEFAPRVGDGAKSRDTGARPRGVQLSALVTGVVFSYVEVEVSSLDGVIVALVGDGVGVELRSGEGEAGDSGLRKGEVRGEPKERGEGL